MSRTTITRKKLSRQPGYSTCGNPQTESGAALTKKPVARAVTANSRELNWSEGKKTPVQASSSRLQQVPLGVIHLSETWEVLEYRREGDGSGLQHTPLGRHLFSVAPWTRNAEFVNILKSAIEAGVSNAHFDFKVLEDMAEHTIHVNIFALGDMTTWLFISDKSLPPL
jgi:hypothetical protein